MNTAAYPRPLLAGISGFLALIGLMEALALARGFGFMDEVTERRALGFAMGLLMIVIGNLLPKLRPLGSTHPDPARAAGGERFAGRVLLLAGLAYVVLFAFAPLAAARSASAVVGIVALALVAADWVWLARGVLSRSRRQERQPASVRVRVTAQLLLACFFLLAVTCIKVLSAGQPWAEAFDDWFLAVFLILFTALRGFLGIGRAQHP
jgi:hypothetical protein